MKPKTLTLITALAVLTIILIVITAHALPKKDSSHKVTSEPTSHSADATLTLTEVNDHSDETSCWTVVDGNVYDLTPFITEHPGGKRAVLSLCGTDGTSAFHNQHGTQEDPAHELKEHLIGVLAE